VDGNVVVACGLFDASPFLVSYFIKGKWEHSICKECIGHELVLERVVGESSASSWTTIALETERAIKLLDKKIQNSFRILAAKQLKQLYNANHNNTMQKRQLYVLKQISQKLRKAMLWLPVRTKKNHSNYINTRLHWQGPYLPFRKQLPHSQTTPLTKTIKQYTRH